MITPSYVATLGAVLKWEWTAAQAEIVEHPARFTAISGGDRSGKSRFTARWLHVQICDYLESMMAELEGKGDPKSVLGVAWIVAAQYEKRWQEFNYLADDLRRQF